VVAVEAKMKKYWWVNHKQTFDHEINGGYVWAPKVKRDGRSSHFYDNLRYVAPGDIILSFAHGMVSYIGRVADFALSSPKPATFGNAGEAWSDDGWRVPVLWHRLNTPFKPSLFAEFLPALLRDKYAPLQMTGRGNQGAYLSQVDQKLIDFVLKKVGSQSNIDFLSDASQSELSDTADEMDEMIEQQLLLSDSLSATDIVQVIKARRGQGIFRTNVQQYERACRVTGVDSAFLLIASHIKPWRSCVNSDERLDGNNGLLLTPHVDRLFDRGYITFDDIGSLVVSSKFDQINIARLGILSQKFEGVPFSSEKQKYLDYHRRNIFLG
jgi:putative restriction endonuclease